MRVLHVHKLDGHQRVREPPARAASRAARGRASTRASSASTCRAPTLRASTQRLDELGVPYSRVRCGLDVSPRMARDVVRAVRAERAGPPAHPPRPRGRLRRGCGARGRAAVRVDPAQRRPVPARAVPLRRPGVRPTAHGGSSRSPTRCGASSSRPGTTRDEARHRSATGSTSCRPAHLRAHPDGSRGPGRTSRFSLAVGRLIAQKDHATLLRAFAARARSAIPSARLAILGSGPLEAGDALARARTRTRRRRRPARAGRSHETGSTARTSSSTPRAGRASGSCCSRRCSPALPVVATRVSAVPEVVVDGETGLLVERRRRRGASPRRSTSCSPIQSSRARLGAAGLARARSEFSVGRMTERTLGVYRDADSARQQRRHRRGEERPVR